MLVYWRVVVQFVQGAYTAKFCKENHKPSYPYAPIPSTSGFRKGFGCLNTEPHRVEFGALGIRNPY